MESDVTKAPVVKRVRVDYTYAQFTDVGMAHTLNALALPTRGVVIGAHCITTTSPDDGAGPMTHCYVEIGDAVGGGDPNSFVTSTETYGVGAGTIADTRGVRLTTTQGMLSSTAAVNVTVTMTADVNLNTLTSGAWTIELAYIQEY